MSHSEAAAQAAFYDTVAPRYDRLMTATPIDRWTRRAFQTLAAETIPAGSLLLDFGCGTGLDASWYARRGYRVLAYDVSAGMLEQLRQRCQSEISRGQIVPVHAPFGDFIDAIAAQPRPDAVVSNHGVLNALTQPRAFFDTMARVLEPGSPLIVGVLNPFFWKDMARRWWWAALARWAPGAALFTPDPIGTHRHLVSSLVRAASPAFQVQSKASVGALVRRHRATLDWDHPRTLAERLEARGWKAFPLRSCGMFIFLSFRRV